mmetsp:Transcript_4026/g.5358  ORF Transcript_4026/g.5358 Transcript_4026/m.5358 type:complete len:152 (-) Transcript_4026:64-519(-)
MFMDFLPESQLLFDPDPTRYGVRFGFEGDAARLETSAEGQLTDARYYWMDSRQIAVNDTVADKLINITLVKLTPKGEEDVFVSSGQVPAEKLATIYEQADVKQKSFPVEMKNGEGAVVGTLKAKIMFTKELLKTEEEKKQDEMVPAGSLAA